MSNQPCPFCEINEGRAPATFVHEWSDAFAIVPLNPGVDGHTLVIPKTHVADFVADPIVSAATMRRAAQLAAESDQPMNLITSRGREAGQEVDHLAVELIPRDQGRDLAVPATLETTDCPVCLSYRVRRSGRELLTCGSPACSYELRGRKLRGNVYGDTGGSPEPSEEITYNAAHHRARKQLRGQGCAEADATCSGRLEAALRPDLPAELLRATEAGVVYYSGLDATIGYRNLCRSHHAREGQLMSALRRHPELQAARVAEWARKRHTGCGSDCAVCSALNSYDAAVSALAEAIEAANDGLALPWYSGKKRSGTQINVRPKPTDDEFARGFAAGRRAQ